MKLRRHLPSSVWRRLALQSWKAPQDPQIKGSMEFEMSNALRYMEAYRRNTGVRVTVTHLVGKAMAHALAKYPESNGLVRGRRMYLRDSVDVYFVVARNGGEDLTGVIVRNADAKSLADVAREVISQAERLRNYDDEEDRATTRILERIPNRFLGPTIRFIHWMNYNLGLDLRRFGIQNDPFGSVLVTSVGMLGLTFGFSNLNQIVPTSIEVVVGEVSERPWVEDGQVVARPLLILGGTFDHRMVDGFHAAMLAREIRQFMEDPGKAMGEVDIVAARPAAPSNPSL